MSKRPVLVIDDDDCIRENLVAALEIEGYEVMSAMNGLEGLERLRALPLDRRPGCIILDFMMPGMDGAEFLEELRKEFAPEQLPLKVVLTTAAGNHLPAALLASDVIHLAKPMELSHLYKIVGEHCDLSHRRPEMGRD